MKRLLLCLALVAPLGVQAEELTHVPYTAP